jgi:glycosyltransferase involved in cell wall biosynthesis
MSEARVFVLLSEYEGFSHVLLEALASGLPTVASTAGGNRELIRDDIDGLLVPPGDEARAAAAMEAVLDNDDRWQRFSAAGIRRARDFTWSRLMEQTVDLFSSVDATNIGVAGGRWRASSR